MGEMVSTCARKEPRPLRAVTVSSGRRRWLLTAVLVAGLLSVLVVGAFAINSHVIYQRASGEGPLWAYIVTAATDRPLFGTEKMANCVIGDLDGDGAEDEIVYQTDQPYTLGYYKIAADGEYHPENDHLISGLTADDAVPQAIVREASTGWGTIIYRSANLNSSYAVRYQDGSWLDTYVGLMDRVYAADVRGQGFKGDLFYQIGVPQPDPTTNFFRCFWREGIDGLDHEMVETIAGHPNYLWQAYGVGKLIPNRPNSTLVFYSSIPAPTGGENIFAVCDPDWNYTVLGGTNGAWGPLFGREYLHFGRVDDSGYDSIVFCNGPDLPLQFYRPGEAGPGELVYEEGDPFPCDLCPWDPTHYVNTDPEWPTGVPGRDGCVVKGVVTGIALAPRYVIPIEHISEIRALEVGDTVSVTGMVKTLDVVQRNPQTQELETTGFYIEELTRVAGIRIVVDTEPVAEGSRVSLTGTIAEVDGELVVNVDPSELTVAPPDVATFAINPDGTGRTFVANTLDGSEVSSYWWRGENGVAAGDVLGTGVKNDLLYVARNGDLMWREGISGPEHFIKAADPTGGPYWPLATGYVLPDKPQHRIFTFMGDPWNSNASNAYSVDTSGDAVKIWEITSNWGSMDITRMDASRVGGPDDVLFFNIALQWSKIAWDEANSRYVHDPNGYWVDLYTLFKPTLFGQFDAGCANGVHRARILTQSGIRNCVAGKVADRDFGKLAYSKTVYYVPDADKYGYAVYDPGPAGTIYQMDNSEKVSLARYVDIDGDGMDDIVYQDYNTGEMCWYKMTSEWFGTSPTIPWHPENVHKIADYGAPLAVLEPASGPKKIIFYDKVTLGALGTTVKALYGPGISLNGLLVRTAGTVSDPDPYDGTFTISDGSPLPLTVYCPDPELPTNLDGSFVTVTGCVGSESLGASKVPVLRVPSASNIR